MARAFTSSETSSGMKSCSALIASSRCSRPLPLNPLKRRFQLLAELLRDLAKGKMHSRELHIPLRPMSKERPRSFSGQTRPYMSRNYKLWLKDAMAVMTEWWVQPPLERTECIGITLFGPARGDLDNKAGSVMDALVKSRVITDDNVNVVPNLNLRFRRAKTKDAHIHVRILWRAND